MKAPEIPTIEKNRPFLSYVVQGKNLKFSSKIFFFSNLRRIKISFALASIVFPKKTVAIIRNSWILDSLVKRRTNGRIRPTQISRFYNRIVIWEGPVPREVPENMDRFSSFKNSILDFKKNCFIPNFTTLGQKLWPESCIQKGRHTAICQSNVYVI